MRTRLRSGMAWWRMAVRWDRHSVTDVQWWDVRYRKWKKLCWRKDHHMCWSQIKWTKQNFTTLRLGWRGECTQWGGHLTEEPRTLRGNVLRVNQWSGKIELEIGNLARSTKQWWINLHWQARMRRTNLLTSRGTSWSYTLHIGQTVGAGRTRIRNRPFGVWGRGMTS